MNEVDRFVIKGHEKVIDHYRRLRDSSKTDLERVEFQRRIDGALEHLNIYIEERMPTISRAA